MPEIYLLNAEHLIQDYLDTAHAIGREPNYTHFHTRHRHCLKVLVRVFGKPGWSNLQKAAAGKKWRAGLRKHGLRTGAVAAGPRRTLNPVRTEGEILEEIWAIYRALIAANQAGKKKKSSKEQRNVWKLSNRLNDLFYETGRVISLKEAFK